jgi:hypothetical protein
MTTHIATDAPLAAGRLLSVTSPMLSGPDVLAVQERLAELGYSPGVADGFYGDATAAAVRAFQAEHALAADGVVGPLTLAALAQAKPRQDGNGNGGALGRRALAEALRHLGKRESPSGSNRTEFGRWYGVDGVPWCNIFVSYCFKVGAGYTICEGHRGAGVNANGCAYVPTTEAWLRSAGLWIGRGAPEPGDIVIFNWDQRGVPEHIGIVEANLGGGRFRTIEGNTAVGNDSNGGQVMRRDRYLSQVNGFGRVRA